MEKLKIKLHVLRITYSISTTNHSSKVVITSEYWENAVRIPFSNMAGEGNPGIATAMAYLEARGFNILGWASGPHNKQYIVSDSYLKLK